MVRLADESNGYENGRRAICGDVFQLPFADDAFETTVSIRLLHLNYTRRATPADPARIGSSFPAFCPDQPVSIHPPAWPGEKVAFHSRTGAPDDREPTGGSSYLRRRKTRTPSTLTPFPPHANLCAAFQEGQSELIFGPFRAGRLQQVRSVRVLTATMGMLGLASRLTAGSNDSDAVVFTVPDEDRAVGVHENPVESCQLARERIPVRPITLASGPCDQFHRACASSRSSERCDSRCRPDTHFRPDRD